MVLNPGNVAVHTHMHELYAGDEGEEELMNNRLACVVFLKLKQELQVLN